VSHLFTLRFERSQGKRNLNPWIDQLLAGRVDEQN
jgi:hypothetical protein